LIRVENICDTSSTNKLFQYITPHLAGIGGQIKAKPEYFSVEEIPLYEPSGSGDHPYVCIGREGFTTRDAAIKLAQLFNIRERDIGYAGLKDKQARTIQTFSLPLKDISLALVRKKIEDNLPFRVHSISRHTNKLRRGHLKGNRFRVVVTETSDVSEEAVSQIVNVLRSIPIPNFYGEQRFGIERKNISEGKQIVNGRVVCKDPWLKSMFVSAFQSYLFNRWLVMRMESDRFSTFLTGDIAKKTDTGGLFRVLDPETENNRLAQKEIALAGPIFGSDMYESFDEAKAFEDELLKHEACKPEWIANMPLVGSRRAAQIWIDDLKFERSLERFIFSFTLPKGSYATVVLREIMKNDVVLPEGLV